jgi:hypothetical protein
MNEVFFRFDDLRKRVVHLTDMIDARTEVKAQFLGKAKTALKDVLDEHYDPDSPFASLHWAKLVMLQVYRAKMALLEAKRLYGEELPQTKNAHRCATNMVRKIGRRIRRAEKNLTERY